MKDQMKQEVLSWITETFRNLNNIRIEFPSYATSGGSLGDIIFVDVFGQTNEREEIFHVIIKRSKSDLRVLDGLNLRVAFINEINLYSKIKPFFKKFAQERNVPFFDNIPECFGTITKNNLYVILMENLKPKGFKMHQLDTPQNSACAKLVLEGYAKWQALCLAVKDQEPGIYKSFGEINQDFLQKKLLKLSLASGKKELDYVVGLYKEKREDEMVRIVEAFKNKFEEKYIESISTKNCNFPVIRHGDCWNNNFLFKFETDTTDPSRVFIIDWQNSALGPPLVDVTHYLLSSCSTSVYESIESLIEFYYGILSTDLRRLGSDPEKCFSWNDCLDNFKECIQPAIFIKPLFVRASLVTEFNPSFDIVQTPDDGDCHGMFGDTLRDPDEYFRRVDDTFKIFMKKGFI